MAQSMSQFAAGFDYEAHQRRMAQIGQTANAEVAERKAQEAAKPAKQKRTKKPVTSEHVHQCAVIKWAQGQHWLGLMPGINLLFAIPNGGQRKPGVAGKLRAEGVKAGVSDLFLPVARRGFHGLFLEMKSEKGKPTELQMEFQLAVEDQGYCASVAFSASDAITIIEWYYAGSEK